MPIKRHKVDLSVEKSILTGIIMSSKYLCEVIPLYHPDLLEINYSSIIARWCIQHYRKYEEAPGILIQDLFKTWQKTATDKEQVKYIENFLASLSDEYEHATKFNVEYLLDKTVLYFKERSLKLLSEDINYHLENKDLQAAEETYLDFRKVEKIISSGIDVLDDENAWRDAFDVNTDILFTVPGKLGTSLLNSQFTRDSFISLMGIAKIGKTWNLTFLAHCAVRARCNVAMFQVGDLSQGQMMLRNGIYITRRSNKTKYCGELLLPVLDCQNNQKNVCTSRKRKGKFGCYDTENVLLTYDEAVGYVPCTECRSIPKSTFKGAIWHEKRRPVRPLTWQEAYKAAQEYKQRTNAKRFKLSTHSSRSVSVAGIKSQLETWERLENWIPDVIIIDYADILAPERKGNKEGRDDINETWMALRGLSQEKHCCVITATQANGSAINEKSVGRQHYANDRRKYDHCTAMFGLSQTHEEKRKGLIRWGAIVIREDEWDEEYQINVLGCLAIGRPYLDSY